MSSFDYSEYYSIWHSYDPAHLKAMREFYQNSFGHFLPDRPAGNALDIGCGIGLAMLYLKESGYERVSGIEIDPGQVERGKSQGLDVHLVEDSAAFLDSKPEGHYSIITLLDVLEHLDRTKQVPLLKAIRRALKPGGRVIVEVPNASSYFANRWRYNDPTHTSSFTERALQRAFLESGFNRLNISRKGMPSRPPFRFWTPANRLNFIRWLGYSLWRKVLRLEDPEGARPLNLCVNLVVMAEREA